MIIKKWNGSAWTEQYPKTTIAEVYLADGTTAAFAGNKIAASLLPNSVFDSLKFEGTVAGNATSASFALALEGIVDQATTDTRSAVGYYLVFSSGGTINQATTSVQTTLGNNLYYQWTFKNNDAGATSVTSSGTVETGDWVVVDGISGAGSSGNPYIFTLAIISNTYELATSTVPGIVELGSDTVQSTAANAVTSTASRTYAIQANSSGQMVVNVPWSDTNTTYGVASTGTLGLVKLGNDTTQTTAANGVTTTASRSYAVQLNASQQMVVNVPWTDTNTTYSAGNGISLSSTTFSVAAGVGLTQEASGLKMENPIEIGTTTPASDYQITDGALWFDLS